jgi:hypothetical protein
MLNWNSKWDGRLKRKSIDLRRVIVVNLNTKIMFNIGDKVLCIDDSKSGDPRAITNGKVYTISGYYGTLFQEATGLEINVYHLEGVGKHNVFFETRFKLFREIISKNSYII